MKRTLTMLGLVTALILAAALPASAAPRNANNEDFVIPLTCVDAEGGETDWEAVRPTPADEGKPAWEADEGWLQVGKSFNFTVTVTATVVADDGEHASVPVFEEGSDHGSERGNKDLITCTAVFFDELMDVFENINPDQAAGLNDFFHTDIFAPGQDVEIFETGVLTVKAMVPGRR